MGLFGKKKKEQTCSCGGACTALNAENADASVKVLGSGCAKCNELEQATREALAELDMEQTQYSKLLSDIPPVDVVITMGCNVQCPNLPCKHREDWGLDDPTGQPDEVFLDVMQRIHEKVSMLRDRLTQPDGVL